MYNIQQVKLVIGNVVIRIWVVMNPVEESLKSLIKNVNM